VTAFDHREPQPSTTESTNPEWSISDFAEQTPGIIYALLVAGDGLLIAASDGLDRDLADKTAATSASLIAVARAVGEQFLAGDPEILTFRTPTLHFLFMEVPDRAGLAVLADRTSDLGVVGHQMRRFVAAVGSRLNPDTRRSPVAASALPPTR
jgi:uncharacterized protein